MVEETIFTAHSSMLKSWSLLSDLAGYGRWHPHYRVLNDAIPGKDFLLSWLIFEDRRVKILLRLDPVEKPRTIGWSGGVRGLLALKERYEISPIANGVEIRHSVECRGLVGILLGSIARGGIRKNMAVQDAAFLTHLKKQGRMPQSGRGSVRKPAPSTLPREADND